VIASIAGPCILRVNTHVSHLGFVAAAEIASIPIDEDVLKIGICRGSVASNDVDEIIQRDVGLLEGVVAPW
jgi:hypothetical protein